MSRTRTARPKLSFTQFIKGSIIRVGLAKKVKVRDPKPLPDGTRVSRTQFKIVWHRVALVCAGLFLAGWISLATAGYFFVKEARKFPEIRFVDVAFPWRWDHYRTALGDYYIQQAKETLEAGEFAGVLHLLRVGVQQSPDNTEGRIALAQIYNMMGRPDLGIDLLQARVGEHADNTEYVSSLITLLFANHDDMAVEELAERLLAGSKEPTDRNVALAMAAATANFNRGNYDRAEEIIQDFKLLDSRTGTLLSARIAWDLGDSAQAIRLMERVLENPGSLEAQVSDFLIEYLWSSGRHDRAQQVAVERFISDPLSFGPRVRLLYIHNKRGDILKEATDIETFFRLFSDDPNAMNALGEFAAQTSNPELAEKVYQHARNHRLPSEGPTLSLLEANVIAGNYRQALDLYQSIEDKTGEWTPLQQARLQPILVTAYLGAGNTERGDAVLNEMLVVRRNANPADLMKLAERLTEISRFSQARDVLNHIHATQPLNQEALTKLIRLDLETGNNRDIVRNLGRLLTMRKPSLVVLESAHSHISSDRFLFQPNRESMLESLEAALVSGRSRDS